MDQENRNVILLGIVTAAVVAGGVFYFLNTRESLDIFSETSELPEAVNSPDISPSPAAAMADKDTAGAMMSEKQGAEITPDGKGRKPTPTVMDIETAAPTGPAENFMAGLVLIFTIGVFGLRQQIRSV